MIEIECIELTEDEQLALAGSLTESLQGAGVAVTKGSKIAIDRLSEDEIDPANVERAVEAFVSRRKDSAHYSIERRGDKMMVHSPDPVPALRHRRVASLPPNILKCPYCAFVTPYMELYTVHVRSHLYGV